MWKSILCLCFLAIAVNAARFEFTDEALQYLANVKLADLPASVRESLTVNKGRAGGDASHWCCINDQPVTITTATRIEHASHIATTKVKNGYVNCGFMNTMKCSLYGTQTKWSHHTFIQTFQIPNQQACAQHEVKCCSNYILMAGNCHQFEALTTHLEIIQILAGLGMLGNGEKPPGK